jgi:2-polyprenyl-3-methyl-5-hydroxy-6-metoxy-1,4-benzoquinol methylase
MGSSVKFGEPGRPPLGTSSTSSGPRKERAPSVVLSTRQWSGSNVRCETSRKTHRCRIARAGVPPRDDVNRPSAEDCIAITRPADQATGYSIENARTFGWNSISGELIPERRRLLDDFVVGTTVLDAGCGGGGFVDYLSQRGFVSTGIEKHRMFLDLGRQRGFHGSFVQCDLSKPLPFRDRSFDTTICLDVLEHVEDDSTAIRELARVTRKRLVIAVPHEDTRMPKYRLIYYPYRDPTHLRYYTRDSLEALVSGDWAAGVTVFGEQPILVQNLSLDLVVPRSRYWGLSRVYRRLFRFLVDRAGPPELFINVAAIVDLREPGDPVA